MHKSISKKSSIAKNRRGESRKASCFFYGCRSFCLRSVLGGYLWCFARMFIKAPSGRQRFNVLGALNAISHEMVVITNTGYINAYNVCELLIKLTHRSGNLHISIVLDNARYQKCKLVQATAKLFDIDLLYLPAYSPNLNLIERMWKFIKNKCLYSMYYPDFASFMKAISECLAKTDSDYKKELSSFLSFKFQSFAKSQIIAC